MRVGFPYSFKINLQFACEVKFLKCPKSTSYILALILLSYDGADQIIIN